MSAAKSAPERKKRSRELMTLDSSEHRIGRATLLKASTALLKHLEEKASTENKNVLMPEASRVMVSVQLMQSLPLPNTKRKFSATLPHPLYTRDDQDVCLITTAPQKKWKEVIRPEPGLENIKKIIDINKLRKKFKAFQDKRRLATGFNCFLCDQSVIPFLPKILGTTFFHKNKEPLHVNMKHAPGSVKEALRCTHYSIQDNANFSVMVGRSDFSAEEIAENCMAALDQIVAERFPNNWRDVQSIVLKGIDTPALPIFAHNYTESSKAPLEQFNFPKRIRLELPDMPEEPKNTRKKQEKEEDDEVEREEDDDEDDEDALSDLSGIDDVDVGDDDEDEA